MRKSFALLSLLAATSAFASENRAYIPKVGPNETPALEDGEMATVVHPDGEPIGIRIGDGSSTGGRWLYDSRQTIRTSPINAVSDSDFTVTLGGSAKWTNGVISMFPPSSTYSAVSGIVTVRLVSADQRIQAVRPASSGTDYMVRSEIKDGGLYAVIIGTMENTQYPDTPPVRQCYLESIGLSVYANAELIGSTQDMRGVTLLVAHPSAVVGSSNTADYVPITRGWYSNNVQSDVAAWATHPATAAITQRAGMVIDDGISLQQHFNWSYAPNGYMALTHTSDTSAPVMSIEAMDPWPWIIDTPTGHVATLQWTTNGISAASWAIQTASSLVDPQWTNALILATNIAPAGYASMTASNVLGGTSVFWRVRAIGAVQQAAAVRFGPAVHAPAFHGSGAALSGVLHALPGVSTGRLEIVGAFSAGMSNSLNGASTIALGRQAAATDGGSFVWNNAALASPLEPYFSHGQATFNVNPEGGLAGFYVGASNLQSILDSRQVSLPGTFTGGVVATSGNVLTNNGPVAVAALAAWTNGSDTLIVPRIAGGNATNSTISFAPTNGTEAMNIGANGKIGIGLTNPVYRLQISGSAANITDCGVKLVNSLNHANAAATIQFDSATSSGGIGAYPAGASGLLSDRLVVNANSDSGGITYFGSNTGQDHRWAAGSVAEAMRLNATGLGLGITNPLAKVHVEGSLIVTTNLTVSGVSKIILPTSTNGLTSGILWNNGGTVSVMP